MYAQDDSCSVRTCLGKDKPDPRILASKLFHGIDSMSVKGKVRGMSGEDNWESFYRVNSNHLRLECEKSWLKYFLGYFIGRITWSRTTAVELHNFSLKNPEGLFVRAKFDKSLPTGEVFVDLNTEKSLYSFARLVFNSTSLFTPKALYKKKKQKKPPKLIKLDWDENSCFIATVVWALFTYPKMDIFRDNRTYEMTSYCCRKRVLPVLYYHEQESNLQLDRDQKEAKKKLRLNKACVLIQSIWRGKKARLLFNRLAEAEKNRQNAAWYNLGDGDLLIS